MIRIALLEEKDFKRESYALSLQQMKNVSLVLQAKDNDDLIDKLKDDLVDVIIYCWETSVSTDFTPLTQLRNAHPNSKVLLLATSFNYSSVFKLIQVKNYGYFVEKQNTELLKKAIQQLFQQGYYFDPDLIQQCKTQMQQNSNQDIESSLSEIYFTKKENELIQDLISQMSSNEICDKNSISKLTLYAHYRNIMIKTNTKSIKDALIQIVLSKSTPFLLLVIQSLIGLCILCSTLDYTDDINTEDDEVNMGSYKWQEAC